MKNQKSKLYTILEKMNVKFRILLTGTPLQNNTGELFALLSFLKPSEPEFQSEEAFEKAFGNIKDSDQVNRLHHILKPHLLRRVKEAVLNLPNKVFYRVPFFLIFFFWFSIFPFTFSLLIPCGLLL